MLGPFHIALFRSVEPPQAKSSNAQTPRQPFPVSFEAVFAELEAWPRMFIEPDGSFVWVGVVRNDDGANTSWQLDGHLYDRDGSMLFVELQGNCPRESLENLITSLRIAHHELCVEQRREGTTLAWAKFLASYP